MIDRKLEILWGARAIGEEIDRTERQAHYLLEQGFIRCARKVGATWTATRSGLQEEFGGNANETTDAA